jgi:hypothetical protein
MRTASLLLALAACSSQPPLPAPANLSAVRMYDPIDCLAKLSWDAVPGATGYRISAASPGSVETFEVGPALSTIRWARGDVAVTVRALSPDGPGEPTAILRVPEAMPDFQISISGTTAHLSWAVEASPALLVRGPTRESMAVVASVTGSGFDDEGLTPGQVYFWAVQFGEPPLTFVPSVKSRAVPGIVPGQG